MRVWRKLPALNRPALLLNVGLAVASLAGAGWAYQAVTSSSSASNDTASRRTATVSTGDVTATVSASGSITSAQVSEANFVTNGTVTEIDVAVGDTVSKGQVLAKVDPSAAEESLATAKANLKAAKEALSSAKSSSAAGSATISSAQATVTSAQETVNSAQRAVDGTVLKASMAGTVTAVNGTVGNSSSTPSSGASSTSGSTGSSASSGFVEIADLSKLRVSADFAEADATRLKAGQRATITWSALSGATATGAVVSIAPTATTSNNVNSYAVKLGVDKAPNGVRMGQTVSATVTVASATNVVRVPTAAVRSAGGRYSVDVLSGTQTQTVLVEVGVQGDSFYEVRSGLSVGQQVVLQQNTSNGSNGNGLPGGLPNFPGGGLGGAPGGGALPGGGR